MCIRDRPYSEKELHDTKTGGSPYGPTHVSSKNSSLSEDEIKLCIAFGKRIADLASKL